MIDTDKYEGHTQGPWEFKHINSNWYQCDKIGEIHMEDIAIKEASANARLIADAPLLLEEVKRLSALADALWDLIPSYLSTEATDVWNEYNGEEEE